jgi:hypothetical protein
MKSCNQKGDKGYAAGEGAVADAGMDDFGLLAAGTGATPGGLSALPGMIGDSLSLTGTIFGTKGTTIPLAGGDSRFKMADNMSPIPMDRVFFNYNHFHSAVNRADGSRWTLDRYVFGLEKTFRDGLWSVEFRLPVIGGLDADQGTVDSFYGTQFGNIPIVLKRYLWCNECAGITGGVAVTLPTAQDARVYDGSNELRSIESEAWFLQPYLGWIYAPTDRLWMQGFFAWDFDTGGSQINNDSGVELGVLQYQNLFFIDYSAGYWLYRNPCGTYLKGIAPMFELHYTTTMNDADAVGGITNNANRVDFLNCTGGVLLQMTDLSSLRVAGVAPLLERPNRNFDAEVGIQFIRKF